MHAWASLGRSARSEKIRCAINGLAWMLGGVCTDFSPLTVDKSSASKTCNFSVAWRIDVCDQGLRFAVQKLCTGLPTKSVEKTGRFRGAASRCCRDWERRGLTETHQGLDAVFQGLRTGLPTKCVDKSWRAERFVLPTKPASTARFERRAFTRDLTLSYVDVTDFNCRLAARHEYSGAAHEAPTDHPEETQ